MKIRIAPKETTLKWLKAVTDTDTSRTGKLYHAFKYLLNIKLYLRH